VCPAGISETHVGVWHLS